AQTGGVYGKSAKSMGPGAGAGSSGAYIGIDQAKAIAAGHAGFSLPAVAFSKIELEHDDGSVLYEIGFYKNGIEYEYEIHAVTGEILEYNWDAD
ncbi:MAG: hypothetical protein HFE86_01770, partial [Clostridiales bacterium]|nr:hypothetical protein [Clostridiales bacterium]